MLDKSALTLLKPNIQIYRLRICMNNNTTTIRTLAAIVLVVVVVLIFTSGSLAAAVTSSSTSLAAAFAYQNKITQDNGNGNNNGGTLTGEASMQAAEVCTHPGNHAICSQEGIMSATTAYIPLPTPQQPHSQAPARFGFSIL